MSRASTLMLLAVVTAVAVAAAFVSQRREAAIPSAGEPLLPGLLERVNDVRLISGLSAGEPFNVELSDGRWVVREKDGYPADADRVHLLLVGAASLRRIEPKTANPDLYPRIGLEDPSSPSATSMQIVIKDGDSEPLADLVVGRRRPAKTTLEDSEIYVRLGDDPQSWLVQGKLPKAGGALDWVSEIIVGVPEERIHEVEIEHPDGERILLRKARPEDVDYALVDRPEDREVDGQWKLNDIGRSFSEFELEDVRAGDLESVGGEPGLSAEMRTYDGLVVTLSTRVDGERTLAAFGARFDAARTPASAGVVEEAGADRLLDPAEVQAEASRLDEAWRGWVFELPSYRADYLAKRREEMLAAPPSESEAGEDAPSS